MKTSFYIVVNEIGSVRAVKSKPDLKWNEISIKLQLELHDNLFTKPQFNATITIPDINTNNVQIESNSIESMESAIETATGYKIRLSLDDKFSTK